MTAYINNNHGKSKACFASPYPGKIIPIDLAQFNGKFICQKDAFLCAAKGVAVGIEFSKKLGRGLGFPTLNIPVDDQLVVSGVFAVRVRGLGSSPIAGVASLGRRPTTEFQGRLLLEVHLFDWSGEAYGRVVEVIFHEKLRDEIYYTSVDAMTQQIERDAHAARHYLNDHVH